MSTVLLVILPLLGYILAYRIYGRYLAQNIFGLSPGATCPSKALQDGVDFVPANRFMLFGHHFTTIAGTGPIVGPAIAIIWGWLPAMLWVVFGSIFMGAVHDFGALVLSLRNQGRSIGDIAGELGGPRVRILFLLVVFCGLTIVIAIFALVIAGLFMMMPTTVLPVWGQIPIAVILGLLVNRKSMDPRVLGFAATVLLYGMIYLGGRIPLALPMLAGVHPMIIWMLLLLIYVYIASTLPVQVLLQPRDFINAFQLLIAMGLLLAGVLAAHPQLAAPAVNLSPKGAPPLWPFLFVTVACGAISGFHSLASSGTTSKQCEREPDALFIGYGSMLLEGALAILVIAAVAGGLGMGLATKNGMLTGPAAFNHHYASWGALQGLAAKLDAFVTGAVNMISVIGIPNQTVRTIMGVFIVSFAATTLDSATRIQRYVTAELAHTMRLRFLTGRHPATMVAVSCAFLLAFHQGFAPQTVRQSALMLWPLFGTVNQLIAGMALLILTLYLSKQNKPVFISAIPMLLMIVMTAWALTIKILGFYASGNRLLFCVGLGVMILEAWMVVECGLVLKQRA